MLERGKAGRGIVDTESLVPKDRLLRKIDAAAGFNRTIRNGRATLQ